jgi:predicted nucleic acid-binding protein
MPVVSNTSPLNYLVLIKEIEILPAIHGRVTIPIAVADELRHPASPDAVRRWIAHPPGWLETRGPTGGKMTINERLDRTDRQIEALTRNVNSLQKLAAKNEKRWSQDRQKWERLRVAFAAALDSWLKSA